jgi:hypothetical protein
MKKTALIGPAGKGPINTPIYVHNIQELVDNFGSHSDLVSTAQHLIFSGHTPLIVRVAGPQSLQTPYVRIKDKNQKLCMVIGADSPGSEGILTSIDVSHNQDDTFNLEVYNSGQRVEFWGNLNLQSVEETINLASKWINLKIVNKSLPPPKLYQLKCEENLFNPRKEDEPHIYLNGLRTLEDFDIEFISMPGCSSIKAINFAIEHCEERDRILVIDSPKGYKLLETYKYCKYLTPSDNAMIAWPWVLNNKSFAPPSGVILSNLLSWSFVWQPGKLKLTGITGTEFEAFSDELSYISKEKHIINIIKTNPDSVINNVLKTLDGNKVSKRRLLAGVKRDIKKATVDLLQNYKPTDPIFRGKFMSVTEYILNQIREDQGINNSLIQVNELTKEEEFSVSIGVQLIDTLEFINIEFKFLDIGG